jgi:hypothetical protein
MAFAGLLAFLAFLPLDQDEQQISYTLTAFNGFLLALLALSTKVDQLEIPINLANLQQPLIAFTGL